MVATLSATVYERLSSLDAAGLQRSFEELEELARFVREQPGLGELVAHQIGDTAQHLRPAIADVAQRAIVEGRFKEQIVPVEIASRKGTVVFDTDEHVRGDVTPEQLAAKRRYAIVGAAVVAMLLPGVKVVENGEIREDIWQMIMGMTRLPDVVGLDLKGMIAATEQPPTRLCCACFDGQYPIELPDESLLGKHLLEALKQQPPVGQPGQAVKAGQIGQAFT